MPGMGWIMTIILGGLAGFIAEKIMKADMGIFSNILVGVFGAIAANFVLARLGIYSSGGLISQGIIAVLGACALIFIYRAIKGRT